MLVGERRQRGGKVGRSSVEPSFGDRKKVHSRNGRALKDVTAEDAEKSTQNTQRRSMEVSAISAGIRSAVSAVTCILR